VSTASAQQIGIALGISLTLSAVLVLYLHSRRSLIGWRMAVERELALMLILQSDSSGEYVDRVEAHRHICVRQAEWLERADLWTFASKMYESSLEDGRDEFLVFDEEGGRDGPERG
jgi:hypothetical protein